MSPFQLPDGTRLWAEVWGEENRNEKIAIHLGNEIELEQRGLTDLSGNLADIQVDKAGIVQVRPLGRPSSDKPLTTSSRRFALKAVGEGAVTISGRGEDKALSHPLKVLAGEFKYHKGMTKDLLADAGRSSDPSRLYHLQRLLHSVHDNIFSQFSEANVAQHHSPLACGRVAKASGDAILGKVASHSYEKDSSYHKALWKVTKRDDVDYDPGVMRRATLAIAQHVRNGRPVLVGCTYEPKTSMLKQGHLQATRDGGHSVLIVGCNAGGTEFLYVDPFPGGSNLKYTGGITADSYPPECFFLGVFKVDSLQELIGRGPLLRKHWDTNGPWRGERYLEVISGPKI